MKILVTYLISTYNKLEYLRVTLPQVIAHRRPDSEIVVIDGGSSDGTAEFLQQLVAEGKIQVAISERDQGEAHGFNKGMMMAQGEFIKILSDDDAYNFQMVDQCVEFLVDRPDVDCLAGDGWYCNTAQAPFQLTRSRQLDEFLLWKASRKPFIFCGLALLIRRASLPLVGLWNPAFFVIDYELSLRLTKARVKLAWCDRPLCVNVMNPRSNSGSRWKELEIEKQRLLYAYTGRYPFPSFEMRDAFREIFRPLKRLLVKSKTATIPFPEAYQACVEELSRDRSRGDSQIFYI